MTSFASILDHYFHQRSAHDPSAIRAASRCTILDYGSSGGLMEHAKTTQMAGSEEQEQEAGWGHTIT